MNIFLIGYRGTGKSTVADLLAQRLGWPWLDADAEIERRAGRSIAELFAEVGESGFRDRESSVVADLAQLNQHVIALGGGAVLRQENRAAIEGRGDVIWLQASAETIQARIGQDQTTAARRPNLTPAGGLLEIHALLAQRTPIYRQCASFTVDTDGRTPDGVADEVIRWLRQPTDRLGFHQVEKTTGE